MKNLSIMIVSIFLFLFQEQTYANEGFLPRNRKRTKEQLKYEIINSPQSTAKIQAHVDAANISIKNQGNKNMISMNDYDFLIYYTDTVTGADLISKGITGFYNHSINPLTGEVRSFWEVIDSKMLYGVFTYSPWGVVYALWIKWPCANSANTKPIAPPPPPSTQNFVSPPPQIHDVVTEEYWDDSYECGHYEIEVHTVSQYLVIILHVWHRTSCGRVQEYNDYSSSPSIFYDDYHRVVRVSSYRGENHIERHSQENRNFERRSQPQENHRDYDRRERPQRENGSPHTQTVQKTRNVQNVQRESGSPRTQSVQRKSQNVQRQSSGSPRTQSVQRRTQTRQK